MKYTHIPLKVYTHTFFWFFLELFIYLFIYFWLCWVFVAACGLSLVAVSRGYSSLQCAGLSLQSRALGTWALAVEAHGLSSCGSLALEHRLSSCGSRAYLLHCMWDLPRLGIEPVSPALVGGFLTTAPPGKSRGVVFKLVHFSYLCQADLF